MNGSFFGEKHARNNSARDSHSSLGRRFAKLGLQQQLGIWTEWHSRRRPRRVHRVVGGRPRLARRQPAMREKRKRRLRPRRRFRSWSKARLTSANSAIHGQTQDQHHRENRQEQEEQ